MALLVLGGAAVSVSVLISSRLKSHGSNTPVDLRPQTLAILPSGSDHVMHEEAETRNLGQIALASLQLGMTVAEVDLKLAAIGLSPGNTQSMGGEFHTSYECQDTSRPYLTVSFAADTSFEENDDVKLRVTKLHVLELPAR
jgi:hypothetical protein